jgi:predicted NUDIX family NTP pyrophosphohydrolase
MAKISAGLLLYRRRGNALEVFLVHPGGPFWAKRDEGAWSIPKGEAEAGEDLLARARTEFQEETGFAPPAELRALAAVKQAGGKLVHAFAGEGECDAGAIKSNTFELEWPPRSGKRRSFPEVDRAQWFDLASARRKINAGQAPLLDALERMLAGC